jgi:MraZ protein
MFQGETAITLDDKGRLAVPTAYRELIASACANRLVFTYNPFEHGCLWLFPHGEWEKVRDQVNKLPSVKRVHRDLQLKLVGAATTVNARRPASRSAQSFWAWIASSSCGANRPT